MTMLSGLRYTGGVVFSFRNFSSAFPELNVEKPSYAELAHEN